MENIKTLPNYIYVKFVRLNDEILLSGGQKLWLDVDFDSFQHTPVVGMCLSDSMCGTYLKDDLLLMDRVECELALFHKERVRFRENNTVSAFIPKSAVFVIRRNGEDISSNNFVILERVEQKSSSVLWTPKKNEAHKAKVILAPKECGIYTGDIVFYRKCADVYLEHELHREFYPGKSYIRMNLDAIHGKLENGRINVNL